MSMQQSEPEAKQPVPNIPLSYNLIIEGDPSSPRYDLEGLDGRSNSFLKKHAGKTPTFDFPYGSDWYEVSFKIKDGNMGLRFNPSRPVDAHDRASCPAQFSGVQTNQIKGISVTGNKVSMVNVNQVQGDVGYSLNLVDKDGNDVPPFDPIFQNKGGGR